MAFIKLENVFSRQNRNLLTELVRADFKSRYQGSVLGYLWSLLRPLAMFAILYIVFDKFLSLGSDVENFPIYLLLGIVLWGFFVEATTLSMGAIVENEGLLRKIKIPPYILVISRTINASINLGFNLLVVGIFMFFSSIDMHAGMILFLPVLLELYIVSLAVSFLLAALFVKYRDMGFIWDVFLQGAFYATPILYPLTVVPDKVANILMLNPMAQIIQDARHILVTDQTVVAYQILDNFLWLIPVGLVILTVILAILYFRKNQHNFAEEV